MFIYFSQKHRVNSELKSQSVLYNSVKLKTVKEIEEWDTMLSEKTIEIVKSTVPLLQEKGVEITTRFYEILFSEHPGY